MLAKEAYEKVLNENSTHAKVLQQLGWLYHQPNTGFTNHETAIALLMKSLEAGIFFFFFFFFFGKRKKKKTKKKKKKKKKKKILVIQKIGTYWEDVICHFKNITMHMKPIKMQCICPFFFFFFFLNFSFF